MEATKYQHIIPNNKSNLIVITGPTAGGKTQLAAHIAYHLNSAVISADSRQVYRGMDIGSGKDIQDYTVHNYPVSCHLIDIYDAGYKYNIYEYQKDFFKVFNHMMDKKQLPVMCGGSGLYIETVLKQHKLLSVPENEELRNHLSNKSDDELYSLLASMKKLHNTTDTNTRQRIVRNIEIETYYQNHQLENDNYPKINPVIIGIRFEREIQRKRITHRLHERLKGGMIDEVQQLLDKGIAPENLIYYGLEYKFITQYLTQQLNYDEMVNSLNIAIHQFGKRQMTWFRKMEKEGFVIHWLDGHLSFEEKLAQSFDLITR